MMALGDVAAKLGLPVFPCSADKRPIVANGFKAAATDPAHIIAAFDRPGAVLIGVPTGRISGWLAIDVDIRPTANGMDWLDDNSSALPPTRTHKTRSGGLHLIFAVPSGYEIRNSVSRVAPGIDVRGEGGYVIVPPSEGYTVADETEPAEMPMWLIRACMKPELERAVYAVTPRVDVDRYLSAALDGEILAVARASEGSRNHQLNVSAVKLGTLIGAGRLTRSNVEAELFRAGRAAGLDPREVQATIKSGLDFGCQRPREIPDWRYPMSAPAPTLQAAEPPSEAAEEPPKALWVINEAWDEAAIPPRPWIARGYLMRGAVTVLSGQGSAGKSSLMIAWACALVLGCSFAKMRSEEPRRVATYNVEDDKDEQKRRFSAMAGKLGVSLKQFGGRLAILGPEGVGTLLTYGRDGMILLNTAAMDELDNFCGKFHPDVLIMDPFVELHSAEENDNTAIRAVMAYFRRLAAKHDMALVILHHPHKGTTTPGDPDSLRGASAIVGAGRVILTLAVMTDDEAETLSVPKEDRKDYFRLDGAKNNYAKLEDAEWFHRDERLLANGDTAVAAWPWKPASPFKDLTHADLNAALDRIAEGFAPGQPFGASRRGRANDSWCGSVLMSMFGTTEEQAKQIVASWLHSGLLVETKFHDARQGRERSGVHVVDARRPS